MSTPLFDTGTYPVQYVLDTLLMDRSTDKNIIFATDSYADLGELYTARRHIVKDMFTGNRGSFIQPRVLKALGEQAQRTRKKAEVFTPAWVCCLMNDYLDKEWFFRKDVFFHLEGQQWTPTEGKITFPTRRHVRWQYYVDSRRLELTCGEAPYLVSRYDMATGEVLPFARRVGILDRKLRIVNENTETEADWWDWTLRAFHSVYGYEYQGDSLLIARINLLLTFADSVRERWNREPKEEEVEEIAKVISWNLWQMDGLSGTVPVGALGESEVQTALWLTETGQERTKCKVKNWRQGINVGFNAFREGGAKGMKFDFIIGNPPYQDETLGENKGFAPPIYDKFMNASYEVADKVELVHPARFLFNAGSTPKAWNQKMLSDEHLKVVHYEPNSSTLFRNTDIKGGVAITYHDMTKDFGAIKHFIVFDDLRSIVKKVEAVTNNYLDSIIFAAESYRFSKQMHEECPDAEKKLSKGHKFDLKTSVLSSLYNIVFYDQPPKNGEEYVQILGLVKSRRTYKWIKRAHLKVPLNFEKYKVFLPKANGSGALGEVLSTPLIGQPLIGHTQTFMSIGSFDTEQEAKACYKYICSKFCRVMLGVLKITQDNPAPKWKYVPMQDFNTTPPPENLVLIGHNLFLTLTSSSIKNTA